MAQATWEKAPSSTTAKSRASGGRWKFLVGGLLILGAVAYLIASGTVGGARLDDAQERAVRPFLVSALPPVANSQT